MNISQIEENLQQLVKDFSPDEFIFELLRAYGFKQSTITLIKKGNRNLSQKDGQIVLKNKLFFQRTNGEDIHSAIDGLRKDKATFRHDPRFIVVTDYKTLLAVDTKTDDSLDIDIRALPRRFDFFLPWTGSEKYKAPEERQADVKAAEKMAKLYDEILRDNLCASPVEVHSLNVFLSRLLFCFFAEDTDIFKKGSFTGLIGSYSQTEGDDLPNLLERLFKILNTEDRTNEPEYLTAFPYVNGGLFGEVYHAPKFSRRSRRMLIECGELNWKEINPDIFGSMIQAVVHTDQRSGMGMHYTSVPNIMKVIHPLFLDELNDQYKTGHNNPSKLKSLLRRVYNLKIFDPACGSGNFLIIAYKELRKLEIDIFKQLQKYDPDWAGNKSSIMSGIRLSQFYGIELDDFAHEVAILSMWLAEHQMNILFKETFGSTKPALPLHEGGNIVHGNATRLDWEDVCPKDKEAEIYVLGNPPYVGQRNQKECHVQDMDFVFSAENGYKNLDYICCWFFKAGAYLSETSRAAFVTTSSVAQGRHVSLLWPKIFKEGIEIFFAYTPFKWANNAKNNAGVMVTIIGLRKKSSSPKFLINDSLKRFVDNITPYLKAEKTGTVSSQHRSIGGLPKMLGGNQPREGGFLILSDDEKASLLRKHPSATRFIRRLMGTNELLKGISRWCLWISKNDVDEAMKLEDIARRVEMVRKKRANGNTVEKSFVDFPYRFVQINTARHNQIVIPNVSTVRREYIPIGFIPSDAIITNLAMLLPDPEEYVFGLVTSHLHMVWARVVAGRLGDALRYTVGLCYNTFPVPPLTQVQKDTLSLHSIEVLSAREQFSEKTLEELYDPDKMPKALREAHHNLDIAVERCYRSKPFTSDEERLEYLFKLYEEMTSQDSQKEIP
ncbi:MAG: N-6 DNA methylase [Alphaproteobacteria bacterium]|nr:N-6 DNA methylase [Alphaproteobacteria bacterium]